MKIIGLTGGSGAGKTLVSQRFQALGAGAVDADAVYRALCDTCRPMLDELAAAFGPILTPEGGLDRPALAGIVFADPAKLRLLSSLTFPYIRAASEKAFAALERQGVPVALYDAPTLFQTGADALCGDVIGVIASRETRIARIMARDGLTREAACARIDSQPDESFYRQRCRYIVENNGSVDELNAQAARVWQALTGA